MATTTNLLASSPLHLLITLRRSFCSIGSTVQICPSPSYAVKFSSSSSSSHSSSSSSSSSSCFAIRCHVNDSSSVIEAAWEILEEFNKNDVKGLPQPSLQSPEGRFALKSSVLAAVQASMATDSCLPMLGICADGYEEGLSVLRQWTSALGCHFFTPQALDSGNPDSNRAMIGPVYIKFNPQAKMSYIQSYTGKFRGVIVQIGQKQVGHLPLSLFSTQ